MPEFYFEPNIDLKFAPLVEAWLTVRWRLESLQDGEPIFRDPGFPFALGRFYENVKERFEQRKELQASQVPIEITAYRPHYQFRSSGASGWPLVQLGPGVGTLNFTEPYTWEDFREQAQFLRASLVAAYEQKLELQDISLRYRNAFPFDYSSEDLFRFLQASLNTEIRMPNHIPGNAAKRNIPSEINCTVVYELKIPKAKGIVRFATGIKQEENPETGEVSKFEQIIAELEIISEGKNGPALDHETQFDDWLVSAHDVAHDWFFSLIEGKLFSQYKGES